MTGHTHAPGRAASISLATQQPDGTVVLRRWYLCDGCAEALVSGLGDPEQEALVSADAAAQIAARAGSQDGVIITTREPS